MDRFVHGRLIFAGDAAHEIPPYGARGGNGGIQDADNLGWKLAGVVEGRSPPRSSRRTSSNGTRPREENARQSCQSQSFIWPATAGQRLFRDAVLSLVQGARVVARVPQHRPRERRDDVRRAPRWPFPTTGDLAAARPPGRRVAEPPVRGTRRPRRLPPRPRPRCLHGAPLLPPARARATGSSARRRRGRSRLHRSTICSSSRRRRRRPGAAAPRVVDPTGRLSRRTTRPGGATYVLRPDGHVCARLRALAPAARRGARRAGARRRRRRLRASAEAADALLRLLHLRPGRARWWRSQRRQSVSGFDGISFPDHVLYPLEYASPYPYSEDGRATLGPGGRVARPLRRRGLRSPSRTRTIQLMTGILVLPLRHPLDRREGDGDDRRARARPLPARRRQRLAAGGVRDPRPARGRARGR